ncbi:phosphoribosylformylglycinamidine cyclo-ligase, chloroplastic-like [Selaginella moellendorffii]|uniref:phosphoribosylformylglycinamidine cyclo-ligase, chloroplastic-like n=1 Tax=Selaginella moellendorffii TaxID=88036 RepID=UPI000D1C94D3|nr:phosphoribosylformylglycinamidine cyclo-ligase, chloroplastic-like [Selaginella moellendorffii]|eukprot:XP_024520472.1 phosphoribosylformylglycinamidine cyclo-ligase, chloroplastic-like [Selaginella moellendorffii]
MAAHLSCIAYIARPRILATGGDAWSLQSVAACPSIPGVSLLDAGDGSSFLVTRAVGTTSKLLVAREMRNLEVIGYDLVASALNGLVASGPKPSFFSHTDAMGDNEREMDELFSGITSACIAGLPHQPRKWSNFQELRCSSMIISNTTKCFTEENSARSSCRHGLGRSSQGTLARWTWDPSRGLAHRPRDPSAPLPEVWKRPQVLDLIAKKKIKAAAHISSAGITDAIAKLLGPREFGASIRRLGSWPLPPVLVWIKEVEFLESYFDLIVCSKQTGDLSDEEMLAAFNMGLEMVLVCDSARGYEVVDVVRGAHHIGSVIAGSGIIIDKLRN